MITKIQTIQDHVKKRIFWTELELPGNIAAKFAAHNLFVMHISIAYWARTRVKRAWYKFPTCRFKEIAYADLSHMSLAFINFEYMVCSGTYPYNARRVWQYFPRKAKLRWHPAYKICDDELSNAEIPLVENEKALALEFLRMVI